MSFSFSAFKNIFQLFKQQPRERLLMYRKIKNNNKLLMTYYDYLYTHK